MNNNHTVGLMNFGNTCFMNASIQLLMAAKCLGCYMMEHEELMTTENSKYIQTYIDYMNPSTTTLGPKIIFVKYMQLNTRYLGHTQEDSHEFLTYTLDNILENTKTLDDEKLYKEMQKMFSIRISQFVHYKKEQDEDSTKIIDENMISLPLREGCTTLEDCLELFKIEESDDFTLELNFVRLPKYIFVSLKRFLNDGQRIGKIVTDIDAPFQTNMFDSVHNYKLNGFIMHIGGIMGGHYYAYCSRKINNEVKWFCFNDKNVTEVDMVRVEKELRQAYVFLYSKY